MKCFYPSPTAALVPSSRSIWFQGGRSATWSTPKNRWDLHIEEKQNKTTTYVVRNVTRTWVQQKVEFCQVMAVGPTGWNKSAGRLKSIKSFPRNESPSSVCSFPSLSVRWWRPGSTSWAFCQRGQDEGDARWSSPRGISQKASNLLGACGWDDR